MHRSNLPFEVLGHVGPVLAWAEGDFGGRLPATWRTETVPFEERERTWLLHELPTYSYDNVDEIVRGSRAQHRSPRPVATPAFSSRPSLAPPPGFDLLESFRFLYRYFFIWNGTELCVREDRMEELHELAIRLPAGHIVRHGHAREVSEGVLSFKEGLALPELVSLLPSNSFGLRGVVRQGLSESHLHLKAVTSTEETWANHLLKPMAVSAIRGDSPEQRRLLILNLFAGRLLALAVWVSLLDEQKEEDRTIIRGAHKLLDRLDAIYFARSEREENLMAKLLKKGLGKVIYGSGRAGRDQEHSGGSDQPRGLVSRPPPHHEFGFLLRWLTPTAYHLRGLRRGTTLPGSSPESQERRYRYVQRLHLAAHLRLVQLSRRSSSPEATSRGQDRPKHADDDQIKRVRDPFFLRREFLHQALFRYLVCRTHHWQLATQQGRTTGLRYFREYYGSTQRRPRLTDIQYAELVFDRLRQWRGLRVVEGRVGPPRQAQDLVPWVLAYARPDDRRLEKFGLVVHFKKQEESKEERGFSKHIRPPVPRLRWGRRRRLIREEGMRLYRLLKSPTPVTPFLVGIDAANVELATPPEVFAPVFRFLRELPISMQRRLWSHSPYLPIEPSIRSLVRDRRLGMTFHVGEDFRHLLSGLRAICEVVDFLNPQPGDRLGHGTALALQPEDWLTHCGYQAVLPRLEWLDTLVWVHHFLGPGDEVVGELGIEDMIQRLSWKIYNQALGALYDPMLLHVPQHAPRDQPPRPGSKEEKEWRQDMRRLRGLMDWNWSPLTLWDAWCLRQLDPYSVDLKELLHGKLELQDVDGSCEEHHRWHSIQRRVAEKLRPQIGSRNAFLLLALYWLSPEVRRQGEEIEVVDMQPRKKEWLELCRRVEEKMKQQIHQKELVVEVNPSSNRIIGPMERYSQHHVFNLTLDEDRRLSRQVRVSVNTDNPAVCNTSLAHEYYLLGEILIGEGVPEAEVVKWLEWLRANGEEYNFVRRLKSAEEDPNMERLVAWLRSLRPSVLEARSRQGKLAAFWDWRHRTRLQSHGFSAEVIASNAGLATRLMRLDERLAQLRGRLEVQRRAATADTAASEAAIRRTLETEIDRLDRELKKLAGSVIQ